MLAPNSEKKRERLDTCVGCRCPLYEGDEAFVYSDGPVACIACAPTWAQALAEWEAQAAENLDDFNAFRKSYDAHMAAGGKPSDQCVSVL